MWPVEVLLTLALGGVLLLTLAVIMTLAYCAVRDLRDIWGPPPDED